MPAAIIEPGTSKASEGFTDSPRSGFPGSTAPAAGKGWHYWDGRLRWATGLAPIAPVCPQMSFLILLAAPGPKSSAFSPSETTQLALAWPAALDHPHPFPVERGK